MAGKVQIVASIAASNTEEGFTFAVQGSAQQSYVQTNPGGGNPGAIDIPASGEVDISFGSLVSPGYVRFENLSDQYAVRIGPKSAGSMIPAFYLRERTADNPGGVAIFELEAGVTLRAIVDVTTIGSGEGSVGNAVARIQIAGMER